MTRDADELYNLLPVIYRMRDEAQGGPLKAVLDIIGEQAVLLERDLDQLYDDLFIETSADWVVPYLGDLVGYVPVSDAGTPGDPATLAGRDLNRVLVPRREVADTLDHRSRKGTAALLEVLSDEIADWPARVVEFFTLLGWTQQLDHQHPHRGGTLNLRDGDALDLLDGPFDSTAHVVEVRRPVSHHAQGRYDIPSVGLFVARLKAYPVTSAPACCVEREGNHCYTFSVLGNDAPLFVRPERSADDTAIAGPLNLPLPCACAPFRNRSRGGRTGYGHPGCTTATADRFRSRCSAAAHRGWFRLRPRMSFRPISATGTRTRRRAGACSWIRCAAGWSSRWARCRGPSTCRITTGSVPPWAAASTIGRCAVRGAPESSGCARWRPRTANSRASARRTARGRVARRSRARGGGRAARGVIEVMDSRAYEERLGFDLIAGESLQLRAADRCRPDVCGCSTTGSTSRTRSA